MDNKIYIGTSGYSYDDWKEIFYPAKMNRKEFLEFYSKYFSTVEVNFTYYQMPFARTIEALIRKSGNSTKFVIKAHQSLTHERIEQEKPYEAFQDAIQPLANANVLSCILAQFPFSFKRNPQNIEFLERFRTRMSRFPLIIEFRHASWVNKEMLEYLKERKLGFCCVDEPKLPGLVPKVLTATNEIGYIRFHGRNGKTWWNYKDQSERYDYLYTKRELGDWFHRLKNFQGEVNELYIFFNNHPRAQAVKNAFMMREYLGEKIPFDEFPTLFAEELEMQKKMREAGQEAAAQEAETREEPLDEIPETSPEEEDD